MLMVGDEPVPLTAGDDGSMRIGRSGVTLETLVRALRAGIPPDEIIRRYPSLDPADTYTVIGYCFRHRSHVDHYLRTRSSVQHGGEQSRGTQGGGSSPDARHVLPDDGGNDESGLAEFDAFVPMPPVKQRVVRLRVESRRKAVPRVIEPEGCSGS